ncbi:hypothetical protein [Bacteroides sp. 224]|uniref:hypothetical protein n=1 Tax=Bacteroides sp. 224 TaxID=2302936 RepID=UPI0013D22D21|nr:hypothetical protein [Bacteroides sp. 224]NDV66664.1 hypothetical protein [Bacteroides sp. 224]
MKKTTKAQLKQKLATLGYTYLETTRSKSDIIFCKEQDNGLILSLAIEQSRLYTHTFTYSFYIAMSYTWALYVPGFLPSEVYQRMGNLWWKIETNEELETFFDAIQTAEKKFVAENRNLLSILQDSGKYKEYRTYLHVLYAILKAFREQALSNENLLESLEEITRKIVKEKKDIRNNKGGISLLSIDAYNCLHLSTEKNLKLIEDMADQK